jgi:tRNA pseudouridine32 synthase / 23S rRNA pseudouridine746 synthase
VNTRASFIAELTVTGRDGTAPDLLAAATGLSKSRIKEAMQKGAVWTTQGSRKPQRLRRATTSLTAGTRLSLYYDSQVLDREPPRARLVMDQKRYSVWFKPPGLLVEGSRYGDHATLLRQVEQGFSAPRRVWLVHRLDLEASGLILIAHTPQAAARLSALFQARTIDKHYCVEVAGIMGEAGSSGHWDAPLDGKSARTDYRVVATCPDNGASRVEIRMASGRYHQIRRHAATAGYPVLGDPAHGERNSHPAGLRLMATRLAFIDPWRGTRVEYSCEDELRATWGWAPADG